MVEIVEKFMKYWASQWKDPLIPVSNAMFYAYRQALKVRQEFNESLIKYLTIRNTGKKFTVDFDPMFQDEIASLAGRLQKFDEQLNELISDICRYCELLEDVSPDKFEKELNQLKNEIEFAKIDLQKAQLAAINKLPESPFRKRPILSVEEAERRLKEAESKNRDRINELSRRLHEADDIEKKWRMFEFSR